MRQIARYTADELADIRAKGGDKTNWDAVDAKTEQQLTIDTANDPAWRGIPADWHIDAVPRTGLPVRPRENTQAIHIRVDADILEFFRQGGRGWQGRMNAALRSFVQRRQ